MFQSSKALKKATFKQFNCSNRYEKTFFKSYASIDDAADNIKAVVFKPIINSVLALKALLDGVMATTLGLANIVVGCVTFSMENLNKGGDNLVSGIGQLLAAGYFAVSTITDTLDSLLRIVTHSIGTIGLAIGKTGEAIGSIFDSDAEANSRLSPY